MHFSGKVIPFTTHDQRGQNLLVPRPIDADTAVTEMEELLRNASDIADRVDQGENLFVMEGLTETPSFTQFTRAPISQTRDTISSATSTVHRSPQDELKTSATRIQHATTAQSQTKNRATSDASTDMTERVQYTFEQVISTETHHLTLPTRTEDRMQPQISTAESNDRKSSELTSRLNSPTSTEDRMQPQISSSESIDRIQYTGGGLKSSEQTSRHTPPTSTEDRMQPQISNSESIDRIQYTGGGSKSSEQTSRHTPPTSTEDRTEHLIYTTKSKPSPGSQEINEKESQHPKNNSIETTKDVSEAPSHVTAKPSDHKIANATTQGSTEEADPDQSNMVTEEAPEKLDITSKIVPKDSETTAVTDQEIDASSESIDQESNEENEENDQGSNESNMVTEEAPEKLDADQQRTITTEGSATESDVNADEDYEKSGDDLSKGSKKQVSQAAIPSMDTVAHHNITTKAPSGGPNTATEKALEEQEKKLTSMPKDSNDIRNDSISTEETDQGPDQSTDKKSDNLTDDEETDVDLGESNTSTMEEGLTTTSPPIVPDDLKATTDKATTAKATNAKVSTAKVTTAKATTAKATTAKVTTAKVTTAKAATVVLKDSNDMANDSISTKGADQGSNDKTADEYENLTDEESPKGLTTSTATAGIDNLKVTEDTGNNTVTSERPEKRATETLDKAVDSESNDSTGADVDETDDFANQTFPEFLTPTKHHLETDYPPTKQITSLPKQEINKDSSDPSSFCEGVKQSIFLLLLYLGYWLLIR